MWLGEPGYLALSSAGSSLCAAPPSTPPTRMGNGLVADSLQADNWVFRDKGFSAGRRPRACSLPIDTALPAATTVGPTATSAPA
jgi:hypothetical protein